MYHTPDGDRILGGAERQLFINSLGMVVDLIVDTDGEMNFGVPSFDELQLGQKLFILYGAARGLLCPDEPMPRLTSSVEAAVATVFEHVRSMVALEIDQPEVGSPTHDWRALVLAAAGQHVEAGLNLPHAEDDNKDAWWFLVECLADAVLWDNDYEAQERLDLPPERSSRLKEILGVDDDYYTQIPSDPHDDQLDLYIDALKELTAESSRP